jgi:5'-nucleotidase
MRNGDFFGLAITGTPADCVKIAVHELLEQKPDIVLSGINPGANVGINILYSGTVSAATEGAFLGIPSIAISLNTKKNPDYAFAARFSRRLIDFVKKNGLNQGIALNVNIPALPEDQIRGISFVPQELARHRDKYEKRNDPRGDAYYWLAYEKPVEERISESDSKALGENRITITPISFDLTNPEEMKRLVSIEFIL